jgi:hypothetical protein
MLFNICNILLFFSLKYSIFAKILKNHIKFFYLIYFSQDIESLIHISQNYIVISRNDPKLIYFNILFFSIIFP